MKVDSLDFMPDARPISLVKIEYHDEKGTVSWHKAWYEGIDDKDGTFICSTMVGKPAIKEERVLYNVVREKRKHKKCELI